MIKKIVHLYKQFQVILLPSHKKWGGVLIILTLIGALFETLGVSVMLPLVQAMIEPEKLFEVEMVSKICSFLGIIDSKELLLLIAGGVIGIYILKNLYLTFLAYVRAKYAAKVQKELAIKMLHSYMERGYLFLRMENTAKLLRGVNGSVLGVYNILFPVMKILAEILTVICICVFVVYTDWKMAITMVFLIGGCLAVVLLIFQKLARNAGKKYYENMSLVSQWSLQLFEGIKEVLVLDRKSYFVDNFERAYTNQQDGQVKQNIAGETPAYIIEGACVVGIVLAVCVRVSVMDNPADFVPQLSAFAMAAFRLLPSIGRISSNVNGCVFHIPAVEEVYENVIEAKRYEQSNRVCRDEEQIGKQVLAFRRRLEIKDLVWKFPDGERNVLDHISLTIERGSSVAFVGPSGAGKSTLADIILGLFKPLEGSVLLDGIDVFKNKGQLARIIGFVPQSVYLIDDTIRRNIAFGIGDDEIDDEKVWHALEQAQMKVFVEKLPQGLETYVGERGVRFSGGQTQRLAIARALYLEPEILVLDEATSALDNETETAVMEAIEGLRRQKTLIIIAHRLSTIRNCDKIYEILDGKVYERRYEELV